MGSSTAVDAARAASSSASAAIASCSSSDARADRTRRGFGAGAVRRSVGRRGATRGGEDRVDQIGLSHPCGRLDAHRAGDGVELLTILARQHGPLDLLLRTHRLSLSPQVPARGDTTETCGNFLSAFDGRKSPPRERTWNGPPAEIEWCKKNWHRARYPSWCLSTRGTRKSTGGDCHSSARPTAQQQSGRERLSGDPPQPTRRAMRWCATTGTLPATARSVYSPPGPGRRESKKRYGTGADVWVRNAHGVA